MPLIAWVLVIWISLNGLVVLSSLIAKGTKQAKSAAEGAATTINILLTTAVYGWLLWAVVRLATT